MPYQEIPHTADWCLRVWAEDMPSLFVEAVRGMNALAGAMPASGQQVTRTLHLSAPDAETLLVAFLSELVYAAEQEHLTFLDHSLEITQAEEWSLDGKLTGAPLAAINKTIKAVTFHNLYIKSRGGGLEVEIVFDV